MHLSGLMIGFNQTIYSVEEGLNVTVCINVTVINGTLLREVNVTLSSSDVSATTEGELYIVCWALY